MLRGSLRCDVGSGSGDGKGPVKLPVCFPAVVLAPALARRRPAGRCLLTTEVQSLPAGAEGH